MMVNMRVMLQRVFGAQRIGLFPLPGVGWWESGQDSQRTWHLSLILKNERESFREKKAEGVAWLGQGGRKLPVASWETELLKLPGKEEAAVEEAEGCSNQNEGCLRSWDFMDGLWGREDLTDFKQDGDTSRFGFQKNPQSAVWRTV